MRVNISGQRRLRVLVLLAVVVPLGFWTKAYTGNWQWWVNNWASSFCYEIFFVAGAYLVWPFPSWRIRIAVTVCLVTCTLEFLQLWQPGWLQAIRETFLGRSLLGNTFTWRDLPAYPLGSFLGWLVLKVWVR